ncbi:MAG: S8 family serine peptidase, partial [Actinomycetota bacterium]
MARRRAVAAVCAVVMVLPLWGTTLAADAPPEPAPEPEPTRDQLLTDLEPAELSSSASYSRDPKPDLGSGTEPRTYLIRLHDPAVPTYGGGKPGLARTAPAGAQRLDSDSRAVMDYRQHLEEAQLDFIQSMERTAGRDVEVPHTYQFAVNGLAAVLTPSEARQIARDPAVASISLDQERELHTDRGPQWSGAEAVWDAIASLGLPEDYRGEGIVIGVIDTGISPGNDSFADVGDDGYNHTNPRGQLYGVCDPTHPDHDAAFPCNDKLIGAYNFVNGDPAYDYDGHGSHTASTAGGNVVQGIEVTVDGVPTSFDISGVAPHANVISYLGCCSLSGLTAAIDQAIADEVDVINYSIGSDAPSALWDDFDTVGYLNARAAGIVVATSNGNSGPLDATTGSPADAPWIISVGASTHDRRNRNALIDLTSGSGALADIEGASVTGSLPATAIVYAEDDPLCQNTSGHEAEFTGNIVVCDRGVIGRVQKSVNVANQGAVGFVLINDELNADSVLGDAYAVPGVFIGYDDGQVLKTWLGNGASDHEGAIAGTTFEINAAYGDTMASFSSRGPNRAVDVIVPDVTAPGVDIFAALGTDSYSVNEHGFISGTSMASPHVAGASALVRQARPAWTPAQIQSALMTTARNTVLNHDGEAATPYAQGSGHFDVGDAVMAGLLFDESVADYEAANPSEGGDPRTLNLPSFSNTGCITSCEWSRTASVPASAPSNVTWTVNTTTDTGLTLDVDLSTTTVSPTDTMGIDVTATVDSSTEGTTVFGWIELTPDNADVPAVTMPVAVAYSPGDLPDGLDVTTRRDAGSRELTDLTAVEITDLTTSSALVEADQSAFDLAPDSTPNDPYDTPGDNEVVVVNVPGGTQSLVAETVLSEVPDVDLFVGTGDTPSLATEVCRSTTGTAAESCRIENPASGQWWIMVQHWWDDTGSPTPTGEVTLATAIVPEGDLPNAGVEGPSAVPSGTPFDLTFHWDLDGAQPGDHFHGFIQLGSEPGSPGDIGTIPVSVARVEDDVTKTASMTEAEAGDTIGYDITIQPNVTPTDLTYTIEDTVPEGLTIDPASVTGGGVVSGQTIAWEIDMPTPVGAVGDYVVSTPATSAQCADWSGFLDLGGLGIGFAGLDGDTVAGTAFSGIGPFEQYGTQYPDLVVSEDGIVTVTDGYGGAPWVPQSLPDPGLPSGVFAPLWS